MPEQLLPFPDDWNTALVLVAHPDDAEYGIGAAVAAWTAAGRAVHYALATRGERGIEGMDPRSAGPLREKEQRRAAAIVGVHDVQFWDFPDGDVHDGDPLRAAIASAIRDLSPEIVITIYGGEHWAPGYPNQRDHIEFAKAVAAGFDSLPDQPRWLFENGPGATHGHPVDGYLDAAVQSLAAHAEYLRVLDPDTEVLVQAREQVLDSAAPHPSFGGRPTVPFIQRRP